MNKKMQDHNNRFAENIKADEERIFTNVTVLRAKNFPDASSLYVHYLVDLFPEWEIIAGETTPTAALSGVTHQSRANSIDCIYNFGHCFSLDISRRRRKASSFGRQSSSVADDCPSPLLLLEVYDVNDWGRQRSVGYGFAHFPILAGCHSVHVQTWRPHNKGKDACQQLRENFLGLAPQIENLSYVGIPPNEDNCLLSRFPFVTESSGQVNLRFDTIIQRGRDALLEHQQSSGITMQQRRSVSLVNNATTTVIDDVIEAYHRARRRLKAAHEALSH